MPILRVPSYGLLEELFTVVAAEDGSLLPGCRWLVLGPRLGAIVAAGEEPSLDELTALLRILWRQTPELQDLGRALARNSEHGGDAFIEICVDRLLGRQDWQHPTEVLERPRPDFRRLLEACKARSEAAHRDQFEIFESAVEKLDRAVRIAENARIRRERMRRGRRRRQP